MPKRYHISKKTGRPNICKAKTPDSCRAEPVFGENKHFENKEDAQKYMEEKFSQTYETVNTESRQKSKSQTSENNRLVDEFRDKFSSSPYDYDDSSVSFSDPYEFLKKNLPGFTVEKEISQIDYRNEFLLKKDNNYYAAQMYGGDWMDYSLSSINRVRRETAPQLETQIESRNSITDEDVMNSIRELQNADKLHKPFKAKNSNVNSLSFWSNSEEYVRDDGSKIYSFNLDAEGDTLLSDLPKPVKVDIELSENNERQNARMMESGYVIYDTRTQKGAVFVHQSGSEESGEYRFKQTKNEISKMDKFEQNIYFIEGTGKTVENEYFIND